MSKLINWIALGKLFKKELSEKDFLEIKKSFEEEEINIDEIKEIWENTGKIFNKSIADKEKVWNRIEESIESNKKNKTIRIFSIWRIAAAIIIIMGLASVLYLFIEKADDKIQFYVVNTSEDFNKEIVLDDGTKIWLNKETVFKYPEKFSKDTREVILDGEAYFEVEKDKTKPFIINTNQTITTVLGTTFNIRAYPQEQEVLVSVISGEVQLSLKDSPSSAILLTKGENGIFNATIDSLFKKTNATINSIAWKTGKLFFNETLLPEVCLVLSRYYSRKIIIGDQELKELTFTASFNNELLEEVLKILDYTLNVKHEFEDEAIVLREVQ